VSRNAGPVVELRDHQKGRWSVMRLIPRVSAAAARGNPESTASRRIWRKRLVAPSYRRRASMSFSSSSCCWRLSRTPEA
jgi:hypothetical protein